MLRFAKTLTVMSEKGDTKFNQLKQSPGSTDGNYRSVKRISYLPVREKLVLLTSLTCGLCGCCNSEIGGIL